MRISSAEQMLDALAEQLDVPESRYEAAIRSYSSVGEWLRRPTSAFAKVNVHVYSQGSFRLGTPIRPATDEEHYDLDVVCEIHTDKGLVTQAELHALLGQEMKGYANARQMEAPEPSNRVWTLNYAEEAQFHMDLLPCVPDDARRLLASIAGDQALLQSSVGITDQEHPNYRVRSRDWPVSNPKGYAVWFESRMAVARHRRASVLAERASVSVTQIPDYKVKTPLQAAVQILKRHRDVRFKDTKEVKPRSIIITTLAAHAYKQEPTITEALISILRRMDQFIQLDGGGHRIPNPTNEDENFADEWRTNNALKDAFFDWLDTARLDFSAAANELDPIRFTDILAPRMGRKLVEASAARARSVLASSQRPALARLEDTPIELVDAPHRRPIRWPVQPASGYWVYFDETTCHQSGFRDRTFTSGGPRLPKRATLIFHAKTNVPPPYHVYWQIVNTGKQAVDARNLRGGFEEVLVERGHLTRRENTLYRGSHSIQCFIVKNKVCVAQSTLFVVNIE